MASSIRLPASGASYRLTDMPAGFAASFSMALVVCLCAVLIACFAMVNQQMQMRQRARDQATAAHAAISAADRAYNARYYPLIDCPLFRMPRRFVWYPPAVILPEPPAPEDLPTEDLCPMRPLYPVSFPAESYGPLPANP